MKFNYGKFRTADQKMRLKARSYLLGRPPKRFYVMKIKPKRNSADDKSAPAPRGLVRSPLVYLMRSGDIQKLHGNYISTGLVHIKSSYVPI